MTTREDRAPVETALLVAEDTVVAAVATPTKIVPAVDAGVAAVPTPEPWVMPPFVVADERGVAATVVRRRRGYEVLPLLLLVSAGLYAYAAWWLKYGYHFHIGDALARTLDAKLTLWSRDQHMVAIGVYPLTAHHPKDPEHTHPRPRTPTTRYNDTRSTLS